MLIWIRFAGVFLLAVVITWFLVPLTIRIANRYGIIDRPDNRRVNTRPTPRLGGIALYLGVYGSLGLFLLYDMFAQSPIILPALDPNVNYSLVLLAGTVMFALGLVDDIFDINAYVKLLGQIVAAAVACAAGVLFSQVANPFTGEIIQLGWLAYPFSVFYLVAFANIINLADGLDGLAAGLVAISATALFILSIASGGVEAAILAAGLVGACLAFLRYNFYPAKTFMGDSGSLQIGFTLGLISLFGTLRSSALIAMLIPLVIAGLPVLDTFSAIVRRLRANRSPVKADSEHIHHRFIDLGLDQKTTVLIMYGINVLLALCAIMAMQYSGIVRVCIIVILASIAFFLIWRLGLLRSVLQHHYSHRNRPPK